LQPAEAIFCIFQPFFAVSMARNGWLEGPLRLRSGIRQKAADIPPD
jgi:hypothetical protein